MHQQIFIYSNPVGQYDYMIYVLPGEPYTGYEKLILPFDTLTWTYLLLTFGVAFFVILIVNNLPKTFQIYLYGDGVNMPSFNVIGTLVNPGLRTSVCSCFSVKSHENRVVYG